MKETSRIFLSPPHMGGRELEFIRDAFASNYISPVGPMLERFEQAISGYTGFRNCLAVSSGTAAMHLALRHLGVGAGDVVLASTLTFIGSVSPATFVGAEIIFVDAEEDSWNMDPDLLEAELGTLAAKGIQAKAIIPTDLYGQSCNLPRILEIGKRYGVPVICDSAEAVGARYWKDEGGRMKDEGGRTQEGGWVHAGCGAGAAVLSFNGNKIITTGGGGMLVSDDGELIAHARKLATQAREAMPWYEHTEVGYNYRLGNVAAAIGVGQMEVLEDRVRRRREIASLYRACLGDLEGISFMPEPPWSRSNRWLTVMQIDPSVHPAVCWKEIQRELEDKNIESRPVWKPMHLQPVFRANRIVGGQVSERLFTQGLCLPSGSALCDDDVVAISGHVRKMLMTGRSGCD